VTKPNAHGQIGYDQRNCRCGVCVRAHRRRLAARRLERVVDPKPHHVKKMPAHVSWEALTLEGWLRAQPSKEKRATPHAYSAHGRPQGAA